MLRNIASNNKSMIPKIIHLCWFSNDPFPVEIKVCLDSWKKILPDYKIKHWKYEDAQNLHISFIDQALAACKWAFAADVVRFYAVYEYGGIYMDSDIFLYRRFDELLNNNDFTTFNEKNRPDKTEFGLQAAFFFGEKGNSFCKDMVDYYANRPFLKADGSYDETMCPMVMMETAKLYGYENDDAEQHFKGLNVYPTYFVSPGKKYKRHKDAIGVHRIYGSWRKRKFGRRLEIKVKHWWNVVKYTLFHR